MVSAAEVAQNRAANAGIVRLALRDLSAFWSSLDLSKPEASRDALLRFTPVLVDQYGEVAATVAADFYDDLRAAEPVRPGYRAQMADPVPAVAVVAQTRFGAQHLFTDAPDQTLAFLSTALSKYVLAPGRATIVNNSLRDPAASGWHRETRSSKTYTSGCQFCRMLAGRGEVYKKASATFAAHGGCHCVALPSWDANAPEATVDQYVASERVEMLRRQAAGEPVTLSTRRRRYLERRGITAQEDAQRQLERHNALARRAAEEYGS